MGVTINELKQQINYLLKTIFVVHLTIIIGLLFVINLFVYLVSMYTREFTHLVLPITIFFILFQILKLKTTRSIKTVKIQVLFLATVLFVLMPILTLMIYALLFFDINFLNHWVILIFGIILLFSIFFFIFLNRKVKIPDISHTY